MLQASKHTSRRPSPHSHQHQYQHQHQHQHTDDPNWLAPSSSPLQTTHPWPEAHSFASSPANNPLFAVPRSMESSFNRVADIPQTDLAELMYNHQHHHHHSSNNGNTSNGNTNSRSTNKQWWANELGVPREHSGRGSHYRESSLTSTLGSTEPNSPCSPNMPTPQVAVTDLADDVYRDGLSNNWNYSLTADPTGTQQDQLLYGLHTNNHSSKMSYPMGGVLGPRLVDPSRAPGNPVSSARPSSGLLANPAHSSNHSPPISRNRDNNNRREVPKLDRTMTDVYDDGLYSPNLDITSSVPQNPGPTNLSGVDLFSQRLHDASSLAHKVSQDRDTTHYSPAHSSSHGYGAMQLPEDRAIRNTRATETPQTISPQDSMLDFSETDCGSGLPLFPPHEASDFGGLDYLADEDISQSQLDNASNDHRSPELTISKEFPYVPPMPSALYGSGGFPVFGSHQANHPDVPTGPETGGHMIPMGGSQVLGRNDDGGTYSCTYHGCTQRFDTPALLQKHKREGHRQAGGMKSSQRGSKGIVTAVDTQAGPHRCYRVNPGTGKVCKAVFSRPYDLTRHEDTIHNARKQKVRCDLCAEVKLFSRADALTRHYRVCHPDVELPGKHKRRRLAGQT